MLAVSTMALQSQVPPLGGSAAPKPEQLSLQPQAASATVHETRAQNIYESPDKGAELRPRETAEPKSPASQHPLTRTLRTGSDSRVRTFQHVSFQKMQHEKAQTQNKNE